MESEKNTDGSWESSDSLDLTDISVEFGDVLKI